MLCIIFKNKNPLCYFFIAKKRNLWIIGFLRFSDRDSTFEREKEQSFKAKKKHPRKMRRWHKNTRERFFVSAPFSTFYSLEFTWIENSISYVCTWNRMQKSPPSSSSSLCIYRRLLLTSLRKENRKNVSFSHFLNPPAITLDHFLVIMKHFFSLHCSDDGR